MCIINSNGLADFLLFVVQYKKAALSNSAAY